jgi:hypothetical protein
MIKLVHRTQILLETEQHQALAAIARRQNRSLSDVVREMLDRELADFRKKELADAAQALLADYRAGGELTAFTSLDGEDFNA